MQHRIGFYVRVSTDLQAQVVEGSLDSQKFRLKSFIELKNLHENNWGEVIETYVEEGVSAGTTKRPAFQRMLTDVKSGKINLIVVTDLSRLSRSMLDFCVLLEDLKKYGAKFFSLKEQFDTSTPIGEMMVLNMMNLAQFERKQTAERISLNFNARAQRGLRNGGVIPLGYDIPPNDPSRMTINESEAVSVRRIFEIFLEEKSLAGTVTRLHALGVLPKKRQNPMQTHVKAGRWTVVSLNSLLRNHAYIGERIINAKNKNADPKTLRPHEQYQKVKAAWEGIVDSKVFEKVQTILDHRQEFFKHVNVNSSPSAYMLSGLIYCGDCGRPYVGTSGNGEGGKFRYYFHKPIPGLKVTCSVPKFKAEQIEEHLENHFTEVLQREDHQENLAKFGWTSKCSLNDLKRLKKAKGATQKKEILRQSVAAIHIKDFRAGIAYWSDEDHAKYVLKMEENALKNAASAFAYRSGYGRKTFKMYPRFQSILAGKNQNLEKSKFSSYELRSGGRDGIRTHDPRNAIAILYQLSYSPVTPT